MAPKGPKFATVSDGSQFNLGYFQEVFQQAKSANDAERTKLLTTLERISNQNAEPDTQHLAKLCRARIQYETCQGPLLKVSETLNDVGTRLQNAREQAPLSLTALCLYAALAVKAQKLVGSSPATQDIIFRVLEVVRSRKNAPGDWRDPQDEAIVTDSKQKFEDFKGRDTKELRIAALYDALEDLARPTKRAKEAKNAARPSKSEEALLVQQINLLSQQRQQEQEPAQQQQQQDPVAAAAQQPAAQSEENLRESIQTDDQAREKLGKELESLKELFEKELQAAGPEGSGQRVRKLCSYFEVNFAEYDLGMKRELDNWIQDTLGVASFPRLKPYYMGMLTAQLNRVRSTGLLLHLNRPNLSELIERPLLDPAADSGAAAAAAAPGKDEKAGDSAPAGGGGGGNKRGKNAGKGGGKGGDKDKAGSAAGEGWSGALAAAGAGSGGGSVAGGGPTSVTAGLREFLDWFVGAIKDDGLALRRKVLERATEALFPSTSFSEKDKENKVEKSALANLIHPEVSLADLLLMKLPDHDVAPEDGTAASRLGSALADRLRVGEQPVEHLGEVAVTYPNTDGHSSDLQHEVRRRMQFLSQLRELPLLQRQDVLDAYAGRFVALAELAPKTDQSYSLAPADPDFPEHANQILQAVGDPLTLMMGLAQLLRYRGVIPLPPPGAQTPAATTRLAGSAGGRAGDRGAKAGAASAGGGADAAAGAGASGGRSGTGGTGCSGDVVDVRLARLCDHLVAWPDSHVVDALVLSLSLDKAQKAECLDVMVRLFGELPTVMAKRARKSPSDKVPAASADGNTAAADANGSSAKVLAGEGAAEWDTQLAGPAAPPAEEEAGDNSQLLGPYTDFEIRTDLPEAERAAINDTWQRDILDCIAALADEGLGLGRRLSTTVAAYIAEACGCSRSEVKVTVEALPGWLSHLDTLQLLLLRCYLLSQLGLRANVSYGAMLQKLTEHEKVAQHDLWCMEVLGGEKVRLSEAAYRSMCQRYWLRNRRRVIKLRVLHAIKKYRDERKPAAAEPGAAAGGGGKKKGKGGATAAAAAAVADPACQLPPLPPGVTIPEVVDPAQELFATIPPENMTDVFLRSQLTPASLWDPVCQLDVLEQLAEVMEPAAYDIAPGTDEGESAFMAELLTDPTLMVPLDYLPTFSLRDVVMELARGSMLEAMWQEESAQLHKWIMEMLEAWSFLAAELNDKAEEKAMTMELLQKQLSGWALEMLQEAAAAGPPVRTSQKKLPLPELERLKLEVSAALFRVHARMIRICVIPYAAQLKDARDLKTAVDSRVTELQEKANKGGNKGRGASKGDEAKKLEEFTNEQKAVVTEVEFLEAYFKTDVGSLMTAIDTNHSRDFRLRPSSHSMSRDQLHLQTDPETIARLMTEVLQVVQLFAFHLAVVETAIEQIQVQTRSALRMALVSDPVLEAGLVGTAVARRWLKARWDSVVTEKRVEILAEEERKEAARKRMEEEAKKAKQLEKNKKKAEEEDKKRREKEAAAEKEEAEKAAAARAKEEEEAAAKKKAEEPKRSAAPSYNADAYRYVVDLNELDAEEKMEKEAATAAPAAAVTKQLPSGRAGAGEGGKEKLAARLGNAAAQQQLQKPQDPAGVTSSAAAVGAAASGKREGQSAGGGAGTGPNARGGPAPVVPAAGASGPGSTPGVSAAATGGAAGGKGGPHGAAAPPARKGSANAPHTPAGGPTPSGRDAGGKPGSGASAAGPGTGGGGGGNRGERDRGGSMSQQQALAGKGAGGGGGGGGKGGGGGGGGGPAGAKGSGGGGAAAGPALIKTVPGFDPEAHPDATAAKAKSKRNRRGGPGGAGEAESSVAATAAAVAAGRTRRGGPPPPPTAAVSVGFEPAGSPDNEARAESAMSVNESYPHPPAEAGQHGTEAAVVDLTAMDDAVSAAADQAQDELPYIVPYPADVPIPSGWKVYEGLLYPDSVDPEAEFLTAGQEGTDLEPTTFRAVFMEVLAKEYLKRGLPDVLPVLPDAALVSKAQRHDRPYALPDEHLSAGGLPPAPLHPTLCAIPPYNMPPLPPAYHGQAMPPAGPPFGPGGMPPPFYPPPFPFMPGMPPPQPAAALYGAPAAATATGGAAVAEAAAPDGDEDDDVNDLMGLMGVSAPAPRPVVPAMVVAAPPQQLAPGGYPSFPPGFPLAQAYARQAQTTQMQVEGQEEEQAVPPPAAAGGPEEVYTAESPVAPAAPPAAGPAGGAPAPISPPAPVSWASRIKAANAASAVQAKPAAAVSLSHDDYQDTDEKQLQAAMHASMRDHMNVAFPPLGGTGAGHAAAGRSAGHAAAQGDITAGPGAGAALVGTGLVNRVGEYNCFLNVIIQCLWHCTAFRQQMASRSPEQFAGEHDVVAALLRLFRALDAAEAVREQQRQQLAHRGGAEAAPDRHVVDPSELREALDALGVRAGEMNDASEVLSALFDCMNRAPGLAGEAGSLSVVDRTFGLLLSEEVRCVKSSCHRITHRVAEHVEYFVIIAATGLRDMLAVFDPGAHVTMGLIIHEIEAQNIKRCDTDPPFLGCNTPTHVTRTLHNVPPVFTLQLAWELDVSAEAIGRTLELVDTVLEPQQIFANGNCPGNMPSYALHGMFCYYGQHYFAFINRGPVTPESAQEWVMFDDATVSAVGNWEAVIAKCRAGRIQPSVLFYQQMQQGHGHGR